MDFANLCFYIFLVVLISAGVFFYFKLKNKEPEKNDNESVEDLKPKKAKKSGKAESAVKSKYTKVDKFIKFGFSSDITAFVVLSKYVVAVAQDNTIRGVFKKNDGSGNQRIFRTNISDQASCIISDQSGLNLILALEESDSIMFCTLDEQNFTCKIVNQLKLNPTDNHKGLIHYLNFHHPSFFVTASRDDRIAKIWDASNGGLKASYSFNQGSLYMFAITDDAMYATAGCGMPEAKILTIPSVHKSNKALTVNDLESSSSSSSSLSSSSSSSSAKNAKKTSGGSSSVSASSTSFSLLVSLCGHNSTICAVAFSPLVDSAGRRRIVTASTDGMWKIWRGEGDFRRFDTRLETTYKLDPGLYAEIAPTRTGDSSSASGGSSSSSSGGSGGGKKKKGSGGGGDGGGGKQSSTPARKVVYFAEINATGKHIFFSNGALIYVYSLASGVLEKTIVLAERLISAKWFNGGAGSNSSDSSSGSEGGDDEGDAIVCATHGNKGLSVFFL